MVQLVHHTTPGASQPQCYTTHKQKKHAGAKLGQIQVKFEL